MKFDFMDRIFKKKSTEEGPKDPYNRDQRKAKRDEKPVKLVNFYYDRNEDCYVWDEWTKEKMKDVPRDAVHLTGKRNTYVHTDIWPELRWAQKGQSAIHMYLWMINERMDPDKITEKKKATSDIDWKKILMIAGAIIIIIIVAPGFMK